MATQIVELTGDEAKLLKSLEKVIQKQVEYERKLHDTKQQGDAAGTALAGALAKVEQESQNALKGLLKDLNQVGPEGREVSAQLKKHLVDAGKIGEKSISDMIDELERLDPESAAAARKIAENVEESTERGKASFSDFGRSAVSDIAAMATAYLSVGAAVSTVTAYLEHQREILRETKETQLDLAKAQQEAAKNLAGLTVVERDQLLREAVPDIAAATGFGDVAEISQAIGAVSSAGESDARKIAEAVEQAARVSLLTPEQLDTTAANASAVQRDTGLTDIRQAIALVGTAGTQARITDPQQLVKNLPGALKSLVSTVPQQDKVEAARQAAAIFAQITQGGNDERGDTSKSFTIKFSDRLNKFFTDLSDERVKARSRIQVIDGKKSQTELDLLNRTRLNEFLKASEGIQDPGSLFGRLEVLQSDPALQRQFVGEGFGEAQFQTTLTSLLDDSSPLVAALKQSFSVIQANTDFFEREAAFLAQGTPQLALAKSAADFEAAKTAKQVADTEGAALQNVRDIVSQTVNEASPSWLTWLTNWAGRGQLAGTTAAEETVSGIQVLKWRLDAIEADGVIDPQERLTAELINDQINNLLSFMRSGVEQGALDPEGVARARAKVGGFLDPEQFGNQRFDDSDREIFSQILDALNVIAANGEETAENTRPTPQESPAAAPALSADVP